jgi:hypothetical protein
VKWGSLLERRRGLHGCGVVHLHEGREGHIEMRMQLQFMSTHITVLLLVSVYNT